MGDADDPTALRIVAGTSRKLGSRQRRFNHLVKKVTRLRRLVAAWVEASADLHQAASEHERERRAYFGSLGDLVQVFRRHLIGDALAARDRRLLNHVVSDLARQLLAHAPTEEVRALLGRDAAAPQLFEGELDGDAASPDELERQLAAALADRDRASAAAADREAAKRASRKRTLLHAARSTGARADSQKALQAMFRALALALHPDHERDADERVRKTRLMQEVNAAYASGDLLELLALQLRFEQIDRVQIDGLADERLAHFNELLVEQVTHLERELASAEETWRDQLGGPGRLSPADVLHALRADLESLARMTLRVRADVDALADVRALVAWIGVQRARRSS